MDCSTTLGIRARVTAAGVSGLLLVFLAACSSFQRGILTPPPPPAPPAPVLPSDYVLGVDDVIGVVFFGEKDLSVDAQVRPDGNVTLPLINEMRAAGLTPGQLREQITAAARKYLQDPNVTVVVRAMNSRKVFITGLVFKPGQYTLTGPTTVVQLIAMAGGLQEYADKDKILIMRTENGRAVSYPFNYDDILRQRNLPQNIELKPGDTIIVP